MKPRRGRPVCLARSGPGDSKGKLRKTSNSYVEFVAGNRMFRESADYTKGSGAAESLKNSDLGAMDGKIVLSRNVA